jgi:hypothetical protein
LSLLVCYDFISSRAIVAARIESTLLPLAYIKEDVATVERGTCQRPIVDSNGDWHGKKCGVVFDVPAGASNKLFCVASARRSGCSTWYASYHAQVLAYDALSTEDKKLAKFPAAPSNPRGKRKRGIGSDDDELPSKRSSSASTEVPEYLTTSNPWDVEAYQ